MSTIANTRYAALAAVAGLATVISVAQATQFNHQPVDNNWGSIQSLHSGVATQCAPHWGLRPNPNGLNGPVPPGQDPEAFYTADQISLAESLSYYNNGRNPFTLYRPVNDDRTGRWEEQPSSTGSDPYSILRRGSGVWSSWDDVGLTRNKQQEVAFQVLSLPEKLDDIEYIVITSAGTQQPPPMHGNGGWVGATNQVSGQLGGYYDRFIAGETESVETIWKGSLAHLVHTSNDGFPKAKTLHINMFDNHWTLTDQPAHVRRQIMRGWYQFLARVLTNTAWNVPTNVAQERFSRIKGLMVAGMSRGGCWVLRFVGMYLAHLMGPNTKYIFEIDDAVCDTNAECGTGKNSCMYLDSSTTNFGDGTYLGQTYVSDRLEEPNPFTWLPGNDYSCKKAGMDNYISHVPRANICMFNQVTGQKIGTSSHHGLCDTSTDTYANSICYNSNNGCAGYSGYTVFDLYHNWEAIDFGPWRPSHQVIQKEAYAGFSWYKQRWLPYSHCVTGRSGFQTKVSNNHMDHFVNYCIPRMGFDFARAAVGDGSATNKIKVCDKWSELTPCEVVRFGLIPVCMARSDCMSWKEIDEVEFTGQYAKNGPFVAPAPDTDHKWKIVLSKFGVARAYTTCEDCSPDALLQPRQVTFVGEEDDEQDPLELIEKVVPGYADGNSTEEQFKNLVPTFEENDDDVPLDQWESLWADWTAINDAYYGNDVNAASMLQ